MIQAIIAMTQVAGQTDNINITGEVIDESGQGLPGVSVVVKGTNWLTIAGLQFIKRDSGNPGARVRNVAGSAIVKRMIPSYLAISQFIRTP
ncbi:hypothetical protein FNH22_31110 [Fulvivirga sp. M361]|uniref:hypothetical protein n=1 Tax=Fulvivirga sp. M361 TaxID=2594266 RepID=UPI00117BC901|nr:hypothetical protein [Fulvivirga sp. M361]TRX46328.1 hypothetical protein FNH22_31110 [Fulvivirga sp. M361]